MKFDFLSDNDKTYFINKASTLVEALPYIRKHNNKKIVIKYGGHAMIDKKLSKSFSRDICLLKEVGMYPIIVHGGGHQIGKMLKNKKINRNFINGLRVTDKHTVKIVEEVLAKDLMNDEKECAEHLMLLDLGRNDVGRVSKFGSVIVPEKMIIENYSHVMHIVSDVKGQLLKDRDSFDALMSGFPAGTVTGAPKIRAMEIIHELEPDRRNIYSGAVGYFDFTGNLNTCIAIRTMVMKDGIVHFQSGAGIVHDSDPDKEYEETVNKAKAIMAAIDFAENGLIA